MPRAGRGGSRHRPIRPAHVGRVLRPVRAIGEQRARAQHLLDVGGEIHHRLDEGEGRGVGAERRRPDQLRAHDEGVDAAGRLAQASAVQDEAAEAPFVGAGVRNLLAVDGEVARLSRSNEARNLRGAVPGLVDGAAFERRRVAGDAPAPGIRRLSRPAVRIGQAVACWHVHGDERIEGDLKASRGEILDGGDHRCVGRRSTIGRPPI
jgi:hypothetical protein